MLAARPPRSSLPLSPPSPTRRVVGGRLAARALALVRLCGWGAVLSVLLAGSALAAQGAMSAGDRLGTLFYSAAERAAIVSARQDEPDAPASPSQITVNGVVKRQGGPSTAWINGRAVVEGQPAPPATRLGVTERGVTLDGTAVRVGESLDLSTRERTDIVVPGAITSGGKK